MGENFPFNSPDEFLSYYDFKKDSAPVRKHAVEPAPIVIHNPPMPSVPREDIVALLQAVVLVGVSFAPQVSEKQSLGLMALAAALGAVLSYTGACRRAARNERIGLENTTIINSHLERDIARFRGEEEA